jgi:hypothetical protein
MPKQISNNGQSTTTTVFRGWIFPLIWARFQYYGSRRSDSYCRRLGYKPPCTYGGTATRSLPPRLRHGLQEAIEAIKRLSRRPSNTGLLQLARRLALELREAVDPVDAQARRLASYVEHRLRHCSRPTARLRVPRGLPVKDPQCQVTLPSRGKTLIHLANDLARARVTETYSGAGRISWQ